MTHRLARAHLRANPHRLLFRAIAAALALAPGVVSAADLPSDGLTINEVVGWLKGAGYGAEIVPDDNGAQHVRTSVGGANFGVYMFDCKDGRCGSIQFAAGFSTHGGFDISRMNQWNRDNRWARGYYDSVNDPWVEMDVDLTPGGTYELLNDELATWNNSLKRFMSLYALK
jgi:hypothetical protein